MKKSIKTNIIAVCTLSVISLLSINVSALDYQKTINVGFNLQDTLTVSLSSPNLIIDDLMPGTASDSNIITVNVLSNNPYGYTLNSTVGSTTYANRNLTHSSSASATPFSSINYGTTVADLSSFSSNQWGYSFSTDNGTTWINSNKTDGTTNDTGYSGLPLYTDTENITTLKESDTTSAAAGDNIQFKIAAKADATQLSGEYNNIINFVLTGSPAPEPSFCDTHTCMQNLDSTSLATLLPNVGDTATVYDARDEEDYLIGKLADNKYWMLDNLRLDPANSTTLNNITASNTHASATTLNYFKNGGGTTSDQYPTAKINNVAWTSSSQNYYSIPMTINTYKDTTTTSYGAGSGKIGVYYNYCAASAGSYCYGNGTSAGTSSGNATEDLCPSGWRMPTGNTSGEFQALYTAYSSNVSNFQTALSTPLSGYFYNGSASSQGSYGSWWSSTRSGPSYMYILDVNSSDVNPARNAYRSSGNPLRCIAQ